MKAIDAKPIHILGPLDTSLRILHVGPMLPGSTTVQRFAALKDLGHQVMEFNSASEKEFVAKPTLFSRIQRKLLGPQDRAGANACILQNIQSKPFDVLWIDKGLTIYPDTLRKVHGIQPRCQIVGFSPDDMMNPANQSRYFLKGLPLYDYFITNKSYNVAELTGLGCPKVLFMDNAYDPNIHRPLSVGDDERKRLGGKVGFIGQWEPERAESLRKIALSGIPVRVWGYTWERMKNVPPVMLLENRPLWGDEYVRAIRSFDINLCFLRKCNRDLQTTRTMEIPACNAFMLAERTVEHQRLFFEGKEAECFGDDEELLGKVRYYLVHPEERRRIAKGGYDRCLRDGYSNENRLRAALKIIMATELNRKQNL